MTVFQSANALPKIPAESHENKAWCRQISVTPAVFFYVLTDFTVLIFLKQEHVRGQYFRKKRNQVGYNITGIPPGALFSFIFIYLHFCYVKVIQILKWLFNQNHSFFCLNVMIMSFFTSTVCKQSPCSLTMSISGFLSTRSPALNLLPRQDVLTK